MALYDYKAMDSKGKSSQGVMEADSTVGAINKIRELGLYPTSVTEKKKKSPEPADPEAAAKREAKRMKRVGSGVEEFELWLCDLIRGGLGRVQSETYAFWDQPASRLVDAQAPGLARRVRALASLPSSQTHGRRSRQP